MSSSKITSEVHEKTKTLSLVHPSSSKKNYVITGFKFTLPPWLDEKNEIEYDSDGDLLLNRKRKQGKLLIEHSVSTKLQLVGLQVWRGALVLADYILSNPEIFKNQNILELGSGVGLTSIVASFLATQVVCTDINLKGILELIERNFKRNSTLVRGRFQVMELNFSEANWSKNVEEKVEECSIVLAADVIYDDDITKAFIETLKKLLHSKSTKTVYLSLEKRFVFTVTSLDSVAPMYEEFLRIINYEKLPWILEYLPLDFPQYFNYDRVNQMILMKIKRDNSIDNTVTN